MKKSLIALAVLAASGAAMAQSSVTLFGIVDTGVSYVDTLSVTTPSTACTPAATLPAVWACAVLKTWVAV
jgi:predicted porin